MKGSRAWTSFRPPPGLTRATADLTHPGRAASASYRVLAGPLDHVVDELEEDRLPVRQVEDQGCMAAGRRPGDRVGDPAGQLPLPLGGDRPILQGDEHAGGDVDLADPAGGVEPA